MRPEICMEQRGRAELIMLESCLRLRRRRWAASFVVPKVFSFRYTASRKLYFSLDGAGGIRPLFFCVAFIKPSYWTWKTVLVRNTSLFVSLPNAESVCGPDGSVSVVV